MATTPAQKALLSMFPSFNLSALIYGFVEAQFNADGTASLGDYTHETCIKHRDLEHRVIKRFASEQQALAYLYEKAAFLKPVDIHDSPVFSIRDIQADKTISFIGGVNPDTNEESWEIDIAIIEGVYEIEV